MRPVVIPFRRSRSMTIDYRVRQENVLGIMGVIRLVDE